MEDKSRNPLLAVLINTKSTLKGHIYSLTDHSLKTIDIFSFKKLNFKIGDIILFTNLSFSLFNGSISGRISSSSTVLLVYSLCGTNLPKIPTLDPQISTQLSLIFEWSSKQDLFRDHLQSIKVPKTTTFHSISNFIHQQYSGAAIFKARLSTISHPTINIQCNHHNQPAILDKNNILSCKIINTSCSYSHKFNSLKVKILCLDDPDVVLSCTLNHDCILGLVKLTGIRVFDSLDCILLDRIEKIWNLLDNCIVNVECKVANSTTLHDIKLEI